MKTHFSNVTFYLESSSETVGHPTISLAKTTCVRYVRIEVARGGFTAHATQSDLSEGDSFKEDNYILM